MAKIKLILWTILMCAMCSVNAFKRPIETHCNNPDGSQGNCMPFEQCAQISKSEHRTPTTVTLCSGIAQVCCSATKTPIITGVCTSVSPLDPAARCCGIQASSDSKIIGGNMAGIDEYPWVALINFADERELCGGTLISSVYVLTAAHCVYDRKQNRPVSVTLGEHDRESVKDCIYIMGVPDCADPPVTIQINRTITHPDYNPTDRNLRNDIALIRLDEPAPYTEFIRPICLPSETEDILLRPPPNFKLTIAGWGKTNNANLRSTSSIKMKVDVPYVNLRECERMYGRANVRLDLLTSQMCAGGENRRDACAGDSGGPLMYNPGSQYQVIGLVSFGPKDCGIEGIPGGFTKVSAYNTWIRQNTQH